MTKSEKLIKVCEVLRSKVYKSIVEDFPDPDVFIYDMDIEDIELSLHSFSSTLYDLHNAGFVVVENVYEPVNPKWKIEDVIDFYPSAILEDPSLRFKVYAKGNLANLISDLDKGVPFEDLTPKSLIFNKDTSILEVKGHAIRIARQVKKPVEHYILEFLAEENFIEEYTYKELRQEGIYDENIELNKYINSCRTLNKKIEKDTKEKIKNFLIFGATEDGSVKVNPIYLVK